MKVLRFFSILLTLLYGSTLATASASQTAKLGFASRPKDGQAISGVLNLKVGEDPFSRPAGTVYVLFAGEEQFAFSKSLPWDVQWDSASVRDGEVVIRLLVRNVRTMKELIADTFTVRVSNRFVAVPTTLAPRPQGATTDPITNSGASPSVGVVGGRPAALAVLREPVKSYTFPDPLKVSATDLALRGTDLWMGRAHGGAVCLDTKKRSAIAVDPPSGLGPAKLMTPTTEGAWWICGDPSDPQQSKWLVGFRKGNPNMVRVDLSPVGLGTITSLSVLGSSILLGGRSGACVVEPETGMVTNVPPELPVSKTGGQTVIQQVGGELVAMVVDRTVPESETDATGVRVAAFRQKGDAWKPAGTLLCAGVAEPWRISPQMSAERLTAIGFGRLWTVSLTDGAVPKEIVLPKGALNMPDVRMSSSGRAWWVENGNVFSADTTTGTAEAYLGWHAPNLDAGAVACGTDDCWVATPTGVRRIVVGKPTTDDGYGGFIKVRFGEDGPRSAGDRKMAGLVEEWQGTPYLWGGASRSGTDCSGFVMAMYQGIGIGLGHGSSWLRETSRGIRVRDELRYGDVLVIPGHAMLYIGDGNTAETVSGKGVWKSSIWGRGEVIVKRFAGVESEARRSLASRKGKSRTGKKSK